MGQQNPLPAVWLAVIKALASEEHRVKAIILIFALFSLPFTAFMLAIKATMFSGALPPGVPTITTAGYLIVKSCGKAACTVLKEDRGKSYRVGGFAATDSSIVRAENENPPHIYAEGFRLQNGNGLFWLTSVKDAKGKIWLDPGTSMESLTRQRNVFSDPLVKIVAGLWAISLFNIVLLKRKLSRA
jgi:hypothetical protein